MLKLFRQRKAVIRILLFVIVSVVGFMMVITLVPGAGGDVSLRDPEGVLGRVGDLSITRQEAERRYSLSTRELGQQSPAFRNLMMEQIVNDLILTRVVLYEAERLGFQITPEEVGERLRQISLLYPGGEFIGQEQYRLLVLQQFSMTVPEFEAELQRQSLASKLFVWVVGGLTVSPAEIEQEFRQRNQQVQIEFALFRPDEFARRLEPTESEVGAYFEQNRDRYQIPERRSVRYVPIDYATLNQRLRVTPEELQAYYQSQRQNYHLPERVRARHIFLRADTAEDRVAARQQAEEALAELRRGKSFAAVAEARSDDPNSRERGGELDWIRRGQAAPVLEELLFSAAPGSPPRLVETGYGFHVVQVLAREAERTRPLAEVQDEIEPILKQQKVRLIADELAKGLVKTVRGGTSLAAAAAEMNLPVLESPLFALNETIPQFGSSTDFQEAAFRLPPETAGQPTAPISEPVAVDPGYAVLQLQQVVPAHAGTLEEVRDRVWRDYRTQQGAERAREAATRLAERAAQMRSLRKAALAVGVATKTSDKFTRLGSIPEVGAVGDLAPVAFSLPVKGISPALSVNGNWLVLTVVAREEPDRRRLSVERDRLEQDLLVQKRMMTWTLFRENLKKKLGEEGKLKLNQAAINRLLNRR